MLFFAVIQQIVNKPLHIIVLPFPAM